MVEWERRFRLGGGEDVHKEKLGAAESSSPQPVSELSSKRRSTASLDIPCCLQRGEHPEELGGLLLLSASLPRDASFSVPSVAVLVLGSVCEQLLYFCCTSAATRGSRCRPRSISTTATLCCRATLLRRGASFQRRAKPYAEATLICFPSAL